MSTDKWIGISAGREGKLSEGAVKTVLAASGRPREFFSLASFELLTCDACNGCIKSHKCVKDDQVNQIFETMQEAAGIVFAAPEYWDGMNAKGRAFWERICFSGRHNEFFPLADKKAVLIGVSGDGDSSGVIDDAVRFMEDAQLDIIEQIEIGGEYACYTCGYGHECQVGGLRNFYDLPVDPTQIERPDLSKRKFEEKVNYKKIRSVCDEFRNGGGEYCSKSCG